MSVTVTTQLASTVAAFDFCLNHKFAGVILGQVWLTHVLSENCWGRCIAVTYSSSRCLL